MADEEDLLASFLNEVSEIPVPPVSDEIGGVVDDHSGEIKAGAPDVVAVAEPVVIASKPQIRVNFLFNVNTI